MIVDFILKIVVNELLPKSILNNFPDTSILINFIKKAINSSAIYVKGPEIILRFFLFCFIQIGILCFKNREKKNEITLCIQRKSGRNCPFYVVYRY